MEARCLKNPHDHLLLRRSLPSYSRRSYFGDLRSFIPFPPSKLPSLRCLAVATSLESKVQDAKYRLLDAVRETDRGAVSSPEQRSLIEECLVDVEVLDAGNALDLNKLDGTWMLQYTTASDVISILQSSRLPFLGIGQIFQKFDCAGNEDSGVVQNVVKWSVPGILQDFDGATLRVSAKFKTSSSRNIALQFEEAALGGLLVSEELQAWIAPAFLPRTFWSLEVLQFIRGFNARFPLRSNEVTGRIPLGLLYYISFVDNDMLIGRALGGGGIFVFSKTQALQTF